jgi:hypothetical protein
MPTQIRSRLPLSYINVRRIVGIMAMSLPIVMFLGEAILFQTGLQPSISAYYYAGMRWFFIFTLCCIGLFLFFYRGYDDIDKWMARVAGVAAFLTAIFPTEPPYLDACLSPLEVFSPLGEQGLNVGEKICDITSNIHLISASTLFIVVALISIFRFTLDESNSKEKVIFRFPPGVSGKGRVTTGKAKRNKIYIGCGIIMLAAIVAIGLSFILGSKAQEPLKTWLPFVTYWGEFIALFAFGVTWAVKGETLWKDAAPSNNSKNFNELQNLQYQGYKSGLSFYVLLVAFWFTALLFAARVPPFNLFDEEKEGIANITTNTISRGQDGNAEPVSKIQALNPESLSALCYPSLPKDEPPTVTPQPEGANQTEKEAMQSKSTCTGYKSDPNDATKPGRVEVELTLANISKYPVDLNFDTVLDKPCKNSNNCVTVSSQGTSLTNKQIGGSASETFTISFSGEEISGDLLIIGGDSILKIPFEVTTEQNSIENAIHPPGETRSLGFYKTNAQRILLGILFTLVVVVIYFILNNQILSLFWPLVRRNFRVDLANDTTGEKEALWSLFTNQVNEMGVQSRFSVNPRAEVAIAPPTTLTPESSYLKAFFELLGWIFPRLGYSLRLNKISSKYSGTGLSLAVVQNERKESIAEKTFWASEFGIPEVLEEKNEDQGKDLEVQKYLMIPAFFWFTDIVDRMDGFEPGEHAWQSAAYYQLGNLLWYSNLDAGINLYGSSISSDQKNWAAYAPLGRIWIEKSQEQPNKKIAIEHLLLAVGYLEIAIEGLKDQKDRVYFGALYNRIVALNYLVDLGWKKIKSKELIWEGCVVKKTALLTLSGIQEDLIQRKQTRFFSKPKAALQNDNRMEENRSEKIEEDIARIKQQCEYLLKKINAKIIRDGNYPVKGGKKEVAEQELRNHSVAGYLIQLLPALEFALQGLEIQDKGCTPESVQKSVEELSQLPCFEKPVNLDYPQGPDNKPGYHFIRSHYRVQYNAACFYSQIASMSSKESKKNKKSKKMDFIDLSLDHLVMALNGGKGLFEFAKKDRDLATIRNDERYEDIMKTGKNNISVYRNPDVKWRYKLHGSNRASKAYKTQAEAVEVAEKALQKKGGGELTVHGADGEIRNKGTATS